MGTQSRCTPIVVDVEGDDVDVGEHGNPVPIPRTAPSTSTMAGYSKRKIGKLDRLQQVIDSFETANNSISSKTEETNNTIADRVCKTLRELPRFLKSMHYDAMVYLD